METNNKKLIKSLYKPRKADTQKGDYGHALLVAGNKGKMGAAVIAAKACLRAGAGLVTVNLPVEERSILHIAVPEAMATMRENPIEYSRFSAACIGSGLGTGKCEQELLADLFKRLQQPLLLDADALNIIASDKTLFNSIPKGTVLTPHSGEFDRLFGIHDTRESRIETAIAVARKHEWVIVLKGHETVIAHLDELFINDTGNTGLAKGGSGDGLSGIITAFLAQGYSPFDAARIGVYLHGLAADIALQYQSMESMVITDVIECLGEAFKNLVG